MADADPLKRLERELAEQEKQLDAHRERLRDQLDALRNPPPTRPQKSPGVPTPTWWTAASASSPRSATPTLADWRRIASMRTWAWL